MLWRYAAQFITTGHFDAVGGELKLEAYGTRIMISFLAICLRTACDARDPSQQSEELKLCTLMMTQLSNWSLDLEMCPIDLSQEQGDRLYDTGMEYLIQWQNVLFKWFQNSFGRCLCLAPLWCGAVMFEQRFCKTYKALHIYFLQRGIVRYPLRPKVHVSCQRFPQTCLVVNLVILNTLFVEDP